MKYSIKASGKENILMLSERIVTQDVSSFEATVTKSLQKEKNVSLDLSRVSFLCPDAVRALLNLTMYANENHLHCRIERVSEAAFNNIHTLHYVSQLLSGELQVVPLDGGEMITLPVPEKLNKDPLPESSLVGVRVYPSTSDTSNPQASQQVISKPLTAPVVSKKIVSEKQFKAENVVRENELHKKAFLQIPEPIQQKTHTTPYSDPTHTRELRNEAPVVVRLMTRTMYEGQSFKTTIGRAEFCDVCVETDTVSRVHAHITNYGGKKFVIADPNSTNETLVDGKKVDKGMHEAISNEAWLELATERFYVAFEEAKTELQTYKELVFLFCQETRELLRVPHQGMLLGRDNPWPGYSIDDTSIIAKHAELMRKGYVYELTALAETRYKSQVVEPGESVIIEDKTVIQLGNRSFVFRRLQLKGDSKCLNTGDLPF